MATCKLFSPTEIEPVLDNVIVAQLCPSCIHVNQTTNWTLHCALAPKKQRACTANATQAKYTINNFALRL